MWSNMTNIDYSAQKMFEHFHLGQNQACEIGDFSPF